jgi:hypothetical protein
VERPNEFERQPLLRHLQADVTDREEDQIIPREVFVLLFLVAVLLLLLLGLVELLLCVFSYCCELSDSLVSSRHSLSLGDIFVDQRKVGKVAPSKARAEPFL